ncbi:hypothetical protein ACIQK9_12490 [Streptomyces hydrogenans]|uniref:hypothetical protein n=1 Tax=Streptomyces hydrogenans TaxID=1873719 RepID=UPI00380E69B0
MSYNQPGPYGGQQPQQPGPYGQQPGPYGQPQGQPGYGYPQQAPQGVPPQQPYGYPQQQQPNPYGQQPQYGAPQGPGGYVPHPPAPAKSKTPLIIGAVAVVAAIAVGAYFLIGGGGGASVADDGAHKLITPETVLTEYKKSANSDKAQSGDDDFIKDAAKFGVKNPQRANAQWEIKDESNPLSGKLLQFGGVWGEIENPESTVDAIFANMKAESEKEKDSEAQLVGDPKSVSPAGLDGAVMKCQEIKSKPGADSGGLGPKEMTMPVCVWGDHSTVGYVMHINIADMMTGKGGTIDDVAAIAAKLRKEVRVKV